MSAQLEDAWKEYERTGEICNSAEGLLTHCAALTEHLRLKEEECKQLQQDKTELVEALKAVAIQFDFDTNNEYEYLIIKEAKALLEKHKCD